MLEAVIYRGLGIGYMKFQYDLSPRPCLESATNETQFFEIHGQFKSSKGLCTQTCKWLVRLEK
jgi:hypothetical protein